MSTATSTPKQPSLQSPRHIPNNNPVEVSPRSSPGHACTQTLEGRTGDAPHPLWIPLLVSSSLSSAPNLLQFSDLVVHTQGNATEEARAAATAALGNTVDGEFNAGDAASTVGAGAEKKTETTEALDLAAAITFNLVNSAVEISESNRKKRPVVVVAAAAAGATAGAAVVADVALEVGGAREAEGEGSEGAEKEVEQSESERLPKDQEAREEVHSEVQMQPEPAEAAPGVSAAAPPPPVDELKETKIDVKEEDVAEKDEAEEEEKKIAASVSARFSTHSSAGRASASSSAAVAALGASKTASVAVQAIFRAFGDCLHEAVRIFLGCLEYIWVAVCDCNTSPEEKKSVALKMRYEARKAAEGVEEVAEEVKENT
eukprot:CAMPEP_0167793016 /NCGR_PEP_ID=MMETSP0111_2-20121227/12910_1 /TAXON_ID=91324 /ORGANISM="Lotharella globosa, Strain CCCM811" /LENGTH=372 /DNA_ID=CAMNT_0007686055 /DNA_START=128 /DNA_END=1246 /DNA_ORIENTATION=+